MQTVYDLGNGAVFISDFVGGGTRGPGAHFKRSGKAPGFRMADDRRDTLQSSSACVGRDRWQRKHGPHKRGLNTKIHLAVDALGMPIRAIKSSTQIRQKSL